MVGGGAGGFELALTMHARLTKDRLAGMELRRQGPWLFRVCRGLCSYPVILGV